MKAIIFGSDRGVRYLDSTKSYPTALMQDKRGKRLLDWFLSILKQLNIDDVVFVGGYHIEKVIQNYSDLKFYYNPEWQRRNIIQSLGYARKELDGPCLLIPSNIIFRKEAVERLINNNQEVTVGVVDDGLDIGRIRRNDFSGLIALSEEASNNIACRISDSSLYEGEKDVFDLLNYLKDSQLNIRCVNIQNHWMFVDGSKSLSRFVLGTKAQTLERLRPVIKESIVLDQIRFTVNEWENDPNRILDNIQTIFSGQNVIVRSSAVSEDTWNSSMAGEYLSVGYIESQNRSSVKNAVESVIKSFRKNIDLKNEVFVQEHLEDVKIGGVIFTRDSETFAPFVIINYDKCSNRTDTVTSGCGVNQQTTIVNKYSTHYKLIDPDISHLLKVVNELEEILENDCLDIEFAIDKNDKCYLLQVRPLVTSQNKLQINDDDLVEELDTLRRYIDSMSNKKPIIYGERTIFANMPDWNPAELIGVSPKPLAFSLFQHIISDKIWAEARAAVNYCDVSHEPLVLSLAGHPYVDVRTSFNSFLPACLSPELKEKLVNYYVGRLLKHPEYHHRVEFDILVTCHDLNPEKSKSRLLENGFSDDEVSDFFEALRELTGDVVSGKIATIDEQFDLLRRMGERRDQIVLARHEDPFSIVCAIRLLLDDCMRFGTLPFSILARYAFIAVTFLNSLEEKNILSHEEVSAVKQSISSVASEISNDLGRLSSKAITKSEFLEKYGHLRPGTYDINSLSYAENQDFYLKNFRYSRAKSDRVPEGVALEIFKKHESEINELLESYGLSFDCMMLQKFICSSIAGREEAKFEYTKNLSLVLSLLVKFGESYNLSKDDLSYVPIENIFRLTTNSPSYQLEKDMIRIINSNKKKYLLHNAIKLPHMIISSSNIDYFDLLEWLPNFVTKNVVSATIIEINSVTQDVDLTGNIVCIENADPGYDWIFSRGIKGLITKYGGAASHMAIRAAELDIPAAIGCGDLIYDGIKSASIVELDCVGQQLRVVQ